ncbi:hypothetical protein LINPERHAP2_LOCUS34158 [Linum perenne]
MDSGGWSLQGSTQ